MPVGQPRPVEVEDEPEGDPRQEQAADHLGARHHDVACGVHLRVSFRPEVPAVRTGSGGWLELDALGSGGGGAGRGGYDESDRRAARSGRDHHDGGLLSSGFETLDRDTDDGPALSVRDLDAVDLQCHRGVPVDPRHPGDEVMLTDLKSVGLGGHAAIIECPLYECQPRPRWWRCEPGP